MKLNTVEKLLDVLQNESNEVVVDTETIERAKLPIIRMLDISRELGL
jgi:quinolinate synthase